MKNLSIRMKITLWFSVVLVAVMALTFLVALSVSRSVIQKTVRDGLVETVEDNIDEVEYYDEMPPEEQWNNADLYIEFRNGIMEIDDDFLDRVNGIATGLYQEDGTLMYGENPIANHTSDLAFADETLREISVGKITYYVYDRALSTEELEGLWLRGVVSEQQGDMQLSSVTRVSLILMPGLVLLAILGGYLIAGRSLRPVKEMAATASQIGQGRDLKKRIPIGPGKDELHTLADTFNQMFERLEESFEQDKQFASDVSHELRTPMSVIMAQYEFSMEYAENEEDYREALTVIKRQGDHMTALIEDMLSVTRLERKADSYTMEELDLSELVETVCGELSMLKEKEITLTCGCEPGVTVKGNRELLVRLLRNLIHNAYRYGKENGHILVALIRAGERVELSVTDDGIGIAKEEQEKIFRRFYQVDTARSSRGTGLGLSMVREIAWLHGGEVKVESEPGVGSTFTVVL